MQRFRVQISPSNYVTRFLNLFNAGWKVWSFLYLLFIMTLLLIGLPIMAIYLDILQSTNIVEDKKFLADHPSIIIISGGNRAIYGGFYLAIGFIFIAGKLKLV
jgi:hypothetical protein